MFIREPVEEHRDSSRNRNLSKGLCHTFFSLIFIMSQIFCLSMAHGSNLKVPITVKEVMSVGTDDYPITVVIPLPYGKYQNTNSFRIENDSGLPVPAQFEVMNRWWGKDGSIRHVMVHFQPSVQVFTGPGTGNATYYFKDSGNYDFDSPLEVIEELDHIKVNTGPLQFTVSKTQFNILDELWLDKDQNGRFDDKEKIISSNPLNGGLFTPRPGAGNTQYDSSRSNIQVEIEEQGPVRAVIRVNALTKYYSTTDHLHGFAVRIYAYMNQPFVKVDYQLQNSAKNVKYAWPLYFESMHIDFQLNLSGNPTVYIGKKNEPGYQRTQNSGIFLAQEYHNTYTIYDYSSREQLYTDILNPGEHFIGFLDVHDDQVGVMATMRHFWQQWPNGIALYGDNRLSLQLFPEWSSQFDLRMDSDTFDLTKNASGLYWLEDMQHVYKETLLYFHDTQTTKAKLRQIAATFSYPPVGVLSSDWYRETNVTLDLDGIIPHPLQDSEGEQRLPIYEDHKYDIQNVNYSFNWDYFILVDSVRKYAPSTTGGWAHSVSKFISTGQPGDYFLAEEYAIGELNIFPAWMAGYDYSEDQAFLLLTKNPYSGKSWRDFTGHGDPYLNAGYLEGTAQDVKPRDDQHLWHYHLEEAYYFTANLWIKDWYHLMNQFQKVHLKYEDPWPDNSSRAKGQNLQVATAAYRIIGDPEFLALSKEYIQNHLRQEQRIHGARGSFQGNKESGFQAGYITRAVIGYMDELDSRSQAYAEAFQFIAGYMAWNLNYGNFAYYMDALVDADAKSNGSSTTLVDPQAWYYWNTGRQGYLDQINEFINSGINGGSKAYPVVTTPWEGDFHGRYNLYVHNTPRKDRIPPEKIEDLKIFLTDQSLVLTWTSPDDPDLARYHIICSQKPITEFQTLDASLANWWQAEVIASGTVPVPGYTEQISCAIPSTEGKPYYAAVFSFDEQGNISEMSNLAWAGGVATEYVEASGSCGGNTPCYSTVQAAIDAASTGSTIKIAQGTYNEDLTLGPSKALTLQGGWNATFSFQIPDTTFIKAPKATDGSVTLQMVTIKP